MQKGNAQSKQIRWQKNQTQMPNKRKKEKKAKKDKK